MQYRIFLSSQKVLLDRAGLDNDSGMAIHIFFFLLICVFMYLFLLSSLGKEILRDGGNGFGQFCCSGLAGYPAVS